MAVARDDLGRNRFRRQFEHGGDMLLDGGIDIGERPDGARDGAGGDLVTGLDEALASALKLGVKPRELEAQGRRFGVNAVAAPHARGVTVFIGAFLESIEDAVHVLDQNFGGLFQLQGETGV